MTQIKAHLMEKKHCNWLFPGNSNCFSWLNKESFGHYAISKLFRSDHQEIFDKFLLKWYIEFVLINFSLIREWFVVGDGGDPAPPHPFILQNCVIDNIAHEKKEPSLPNRSNSEILGEKDITKISINFEPPTHINGRS